MTEEAKIGWVLSFVARSVLWYGVRFAVIFILHNVIVLFRPDIVDRENRPKTTAPRELRKYYDFIIIGAGSAGCVVANRLTENPNWNVLLVEAGADETFVSDTPLAFRALQKTDMDWKFQTESSESFCLGMKNRRCNWPRGKSMGGSSSINANIYVRGNKQDYDTWEQMGNVGWGYQEVLKYFKKSENMTLIEYQNDSYHSTGGYLTIGNFRYHSTLAHLIIDAARELGYEIRDLNGDTQTGFMLPHGTLRNGLRCSASKAFIRPICRKENFHLSMETHTEKILINNYTKQAYGVLINIKGVGPREVFATKEVIVSAGSIQSPQLLMLSGIGPSEHLNKMGIPVIYDLKGVGQNLQDHVGLGGFNYLLNENEITGFSSPGYSMYDIISPETLRKFILDEEGPAYGIGDIEVIGNVHTKYSDPKRDWPDIQLTCSTYSENTDGGIFSKITMGFSEEYFSNYFAPYLFKNSFNIIPILLRPKSRGKILLQSRNPYDPPLIYPNYFQNEEDLKVLVEGMKIGDNLTRASVLEKYKPTLTEAKIPDCKTHEKRSDEYLMCQARHHTMTIYHPVGTCKMGPDDDDMAVLDPRLRVRGVSRLRVIDGSVMPNLVSGNTNAPVIMIGEKGSDMIKEDWNMHANF